MAFTEEQLKVIGHKGGNLLVSASAGSGKTTVMVERIIRLIKRGYSISKMLVSTFTTAAADSIGKKLADAILEARRTAGPGERERYDKELDYLPGAAICTLHSWCQKIIRKYFYVTGDDPAFEIIDPVDEAAWENEIIKNVIDDLKEEMDETFLYVYKLFLHRRSDAALSEAVKKVLSFIQNVPYPDEWFDSALDAYDDCPVEDVKKYLEQRREILLKKIDNFEIELTGAGSKHVAEVIEPLRILLVDPSYVAPKAPKNSLCGLDEIKKGIRTDIAEFHKYEALIDACDNDETRIIAGVILGIARKAYRELDRKKNEKGLLSFHDLERKTIQILRDKEAGEEIRSAYTHVFIDEYQDTNPVQEEIISLLETGNAFFVGDIKQSIYAFRGCSSEAFGIKYKEYSSPGTSGAVINLNKNFRSENGILAFVNAVFSEIMTSKFGGVDYREEAVFRDGPAAISGSSLADGSVVIPTFEKPNRKKKKYSWIGAYSVMNHSRAVLSTKYFDEITRLCELIEELKEEGWKNEDIVILARNRNKTDRLAAFLNDMGYPVTIDEDTDISDNTEIRDVINYIKVIDNYEDDIALIGAMRSPLGGFTDAELSRIRLISKSKRIWFWEAVRNARSQKNALGEKVNAFLTEVETYAASARTLSVSELLGRITAENKLFMKVLGEINGERKSASLGSLLDYAENFAGTLSEFLENIEVSPPRSKATATLGSIRIMTVHASKGLEFPVVILYDLTSKFNDSDYNKRAMIIPSARYGLAVGIPAPADEDRVSSIPLLAARIEKMKSSVEEEMRVLYVAMTRAEKRLYVLMKESDAPAKLPSEAKNFYDWIYPESYLIKGKKSVRPEKAPSDETEKRRFSSADKAYCDELLSRPMPQSLDIKVSVSNAIKNAGGSEETEPVYSLGYEYTSEEAMKRGTAFHRALEIYDYAEDFDAQFGRIASDIGGMEAADRDKLLSAVKQIGEECAGRTAYREQPFIVPATGMEEAGLKDGTIVQGVIDLLILGDENEIVDYKTGAVTEARKKKYESQLKLYAYATEKILGIKIHRTRIYLVDECRFMD